jgi:hypothetical protein
MLAAGANCARRKANYLASSVFFSKQLLIALRGVAIAFGDV